MKLKFYGFDLKKTDDDEIAISFKVKYVMGVDTIVTAFQAGKAVIEGSFASGLMGFINVISNIYSWIKAGKK